MAFSIMERLFFQSSACLAAGLLLSPMMSADVPRASASFLYAVYVLSLPARAAAQECLFLGVSLALAHSDPGWACRRFRWLFLRAWFVLLGLTAGQRASRALGLI